MCSPIPSFIVSLFLPSGLAYHIVLHYIIISDVGQSFRLLSCRLQALGPQAIEPQARTNMTDCLSERHSWFPLHVLTIPFDAVKAFV